MRLIQHILFTALFLFIAAPALAQEATTTPEPTVVKVAASDGLMLVGDFYAASGEGDKPAILLMHMYQNVRQSWKEFVPKLLDAGYSVLNVDLRGHGETGGSTNWPLAVTDVQTWLDWLREQPGVRDDAVSIIGASVGSNLALIGCANDKACVTAIALSPGSDYFGLRPKDFIAEGLKDRSAFVVASQKDSASAQGVKQFTVIATGELGVQLYSGSLHGTNILNSKLYRERLTKMMINWLDDHTPES